MLSVIATLLAVVRKPADIPAVAASLNRDLASIHEWCNPWCMILNDNETMAYVVSRSRTVWRWAVTWMSLRLHTVILKLIGL